MKALTILSVIVLCLVLYSCKEHYPPVIKDKIAGSWVRNGKIRGSIEIGEIERPQPVLCLYDSVSFTNYFVELNQTNDILEMRHGCFVYHLPIIYHSQGDSMRLGWLGNLVRRK